MEQAVANTDREIWREDPDDAYSPSIHVTEDGKIGINVGGTVFVRDVRNWHRDADVEMSGCQEKVSYGLANAAIDPRWEYTQYLQILIEAQKAGHDCHAEMNDTIKTLHELIFKKSA